MVLALYVDPIGFDGFVIRTSDDSEANLLVATQDEGIERANPDHIYTVNREYLSFISDAVLKRFMDNLRSQSVDKHFKGRIAHCGIAVSGVPVTSTVDGKSPGLCYNLHGHKYLSFSTVTCCRHASLQAHQHLLPRRGRTEGGEPGTCCMPWSIEVLGWLLTTVFYLLPSICTSALFSALISASGGLFQCYGK